MRKMFGSAILCLLATLLALPATGAERPDTGHARKEPVAISTNMAEPVPPASGNQIITRLPNGLLVYIIKDQRFPLACTRLYVRVGSANEDPRLAGISHVLEHMVFKGTSHRPKGQVARDVEAKGGYLNAATSFDKTWYLTDLPASHWRLGMDVVKDMAFQATLDPAELEAEKQVVISELERGEDSPMRKLYENLQTAALKNTPYGRPIIGYADTIRAITVQDLRDYVHRWYQPQNMMLLVAGDIDPDSVLTHAQELFGKLANHSDLALPAPLNLDQAASGSPAVEVSRGPWNKIYMGIAMPVPGIKDFRSVDLDVLSYLLGGDGTSIFYKKYKYDLRLVDSIDVGNMSLARAGLLTITAQLDPAKADAFWREITKDLAKLSASDFNADALARAKFNLEDAMDRAGETLNGLVAWKGAVQFDLGGWQGEENLRFTQANVDTSQLQNSIAKWVDSRQARVRVLAPEKADLPDFAAIMAQNWPQTSSTARQGTQGGTKTEREVVQLENGCAVILLPDDSAPYISMNFLMPGGNAILKPNQQGLANLTARLLTDGSGDLNNPAMERWLAERAASVSARAGLQTFGVSLSGPSRFNSDYFAIFRDILRKPRFEPQELQREVENIKAAIRQRDDQPLSYMFAKLNPFLFPGNQPYGYDNLGDDKTLDTFNVVSVRDFWTLQSAQPWVLAVAGQFERDAVLNFARGLPLAHSERFKTPTPQWGDKKELTLRLPGRSQAHLLQVFPTVPLTSPDAPALMLLESILSGQSGLLFTQLRDERGLGYTVTAFNRSMPKTGFMAFYIGTTADKLKEASEGFATVIANLGKKPLDAKVLQSGANKLLGDYLRDRQSLGSRASEAATDFVLGYPQDFQKKLIDAAAKLTPQDLRETALKYLAKPYDITLLP